MSTEHDYYLGIRNKETGMVSLLGPYNKKGELLPIFARGSWSEYWKSFKTLDEEKMDEEAKRFFAWEDFWGKPAIQEVRYIELDTEVAVPITTRYVYSKKLIELKNNKNEVYNPDELETASMTESAYAAFCKIYLKNPETRITLYDEYSEDGDVETKPEEYELYSWIDYDSAEFEKWAISEAAENMGLAYTHSDNEEVVVLEVHG